MLRKVENVFGIVKGFQSVFHVLDFSITSANTFITSRLDIVRFILFEALFVGLFSQLWRNKFSYVHTGSIILDAGLDALLSVGMFAGFFAKINMFFMRYKITEVLVTIHKIDLIVSLHSRLIDNGLISVNSFPAGTPGHPNKSFTPSIRHSDGNLLHDSSHLQLILFHPHLLNN